jgi:hypothetical protein
LNFNLKNHRNSVLLENLPGLSECSDGGGDDDDDDTSGAAEQLNEGADEETADRRRPWRERRMKSLLSSIKHRISGDRADETVPREHVIAGNVTLDVLQHLLPNLSTRPFSTAEPSHTPKLSRTLQRQMCLRKQKVDCALEKNRAKTAPCGLENALKDIFTFDIDSQGGVKSASSTPNLGYPDDVNVVPEFIRDRSCNVNKGFRRANSAQ